MEKNLLRIYLGVAYRAGQNGTPEKFLDDLADDYQKEENRIAQESPN